MAGRREQERAEASDPQRPSGALLAAAYRRGIFPMADSQTGRLEWFSPEQRGVIPLDGFRVGRSLSRVVRSGRFGLRTDTAFEAVMRHCAAPRAKHEETWISERLIAAYVELYESGRAHSIEAWREDELVGGLYGVHLGSAFFGESMFSSPERGGRDASKVCLVALVSLLRARGFHLLDTQFVNDHLLQFGCIEISRDEYLERLQTALSEAADWPGAGPLGEACA